MTGSEELALLAAVTALMAIIGTATIVLGSTIRDSTAPVLSAIGVMCLAIAVVNTCYLGWAL